MSPNRKRRKLLQEWRTDAVFIAFIGAFVFVILRLFQVQVLKHDSYRALAEEQYSNQIEIPAKRGDILTSDGYLLAGAINNYLLFAEPQKIEDPNQTAEELAEIIVSQRYEHSDDGGSVDQDVVGELEDSIEFSTKKELFDRYFKEIHNAISQNLMWVPVLKNITQEEKDIIEESGLVGFGFEDYPVRYYPEGNLASHVLGFVGSDEKGEKIGYFGIEGGLNEDLKGKPGKIFEERDALGSPILMGSYKKISPVQGRDVVLTINRAIQYMVENKLKEGVEKYNAYSGTVIVMDPFTGEIIALANYPDYSPANFNELEKISEKSGRKNIERRNLAISDIYEPGSVMKPLTISSAIDLKIVSPNTTFVDSGPVKYSDYIIDNWDRNHHGVQTIVELLQKSNNIGAAWVGHQVGGNKIHEYFSNFGLGSKSGVDLEGEEAGILTNKDQWTDIGLANISFGQGVSATSLQVLNAFNTIANGGYLMQPKIISKIVDDRGETEIPSKTIRRVLSQETSDVMIDVLEKAAEGGEAKFFVLKDYRISGKTGTAEIPEEGKYSSNRTNATFVGFLTGSREFSLIVRLVEPKESPYAAETSAPIWMEIASELVKFYGIAPDNTVEKEVSEIEN
ncbi:penicillin-binding protein 2 [Patescibacteria group bacterium]|nr:penicillin-binding protein 2 [Patescibacteria group bacterium]